MTRIARSTQQIFAGSAVNNGQFGSGALGSKLLTNNLSTIQALPAWSQGWLAAVIGTKDFPALEEFQALDFLITTQLSYLFQEGVAEYDSATMYYQKSIVKAPGTYQLYGSKTDGNIGNALTDTTNWQFLIDLSTSSTVPHATETVNGIAMIATQALVDAGVDDTTIVSPAHLAPYRFQTGDTKKTYALTLPSGWVWAAGRTVGSAFSNATERANADTQNLFNLFWQYDPTLYPIYTSAGALSTRGVSAAADWAANKAVMVGDERGRTDFGKDNMGGTAAGRLTGQPFGINGNVIGASGGQESHTPTLAEMFNHTHDGSGMTTNTTGAHTHIVNANTSSPFQNINILTNSGTVPNASATTSSAGDHFHNITGNTGNSGGGSPFNVLNPGIVKNVMIKL